MTITRNALDERHLLPAPAGQHSEGPCWDPRDQALFWVDITGQRLHRMAWVDDRPDADSHQSWQFNEPVTAVITTPDPLVVAVCLRAQVVLFDWTTGTERWHSTPLHGEGLRCNDAQAAPDGSIWVGTMPLPGSDRDAGALHRLSPDGRVSTLIDPVRIGNGQAWSKDAHTTWYIDTPRRDIGVYRWDPADDDHDQRLIEQGRIAGDCFADCFPDGMCIDVDHQLWVACWEGHGVQRIDAATGACVARIDVPVARVSACCFVGRDLQTLAITTSTEGMSDAERAEQPHAGKLFLCPVQVRGPTPLHCDLIG